MSLSALYLERGNLLICFSAVEDLRYQHLYHPVPLEEKCPALHRVIEQISAGLFNDAEVYEPYVYSSCTTIAP